MKCNYLIYKKDYDRYPTAYLFEVALGKKLCNAMEFKDNEILQILSENLRTTMNLVPNCIEEI